jgi:hypothetical protein
MRGAAWIVLGIGGETRILKDDPNSVQGKGVRHPPFEAQDKLKLRPPKEIAGKRPPTKEKCDQPVKTFVKRLSLGETM